MLKRFIGDSLRQLRGALGLGAFGAVSFVAFGSFVAAVTGLIYGDFPNLLRWLPNLAGTGFIAGILVAVGISVGARRSKTVTSGRTFFWGLPLGALVMTLISGPPTGGLSDPETVGWFISALVIGVILGFVGTAAVKIAEHSEESPDSLPDSNPKLVQSPDPFEEARTQDAGVHEPVRR